MDIKSIKPTAEVTYELATPAPTSISFTIEFIDLASVQDFMPLPGADGAPASPPKLSKVVRGLLIEAVRGWDLTENGAPLECNAENKARCLPVIFGLKTRQPAGDEEKKLNSFELILGIRLYVFAANPENFLKN